MITSDETRHKFRTRLEVALKYHPDNQELQDALAIVDELELIKAFFHHLPQSHILITYDDDKKISFIHPSTMTNIGDYDWDGDINELGLIVGAYLK